MVGRDRGDTAPVVDPGVEEPSEVVGQVGWRLDVDFPGEQQSGEGDGLEEVIGRTGRLGVHGRAGLGQEVLDDHLLDVPVPAVGLGDGLEGDGPVLSAFADADEDSGGERDRQSPGRLECGQATLGGLVGSAAVAVEVVAERLEHHPLGGGDPAEFRQLLLVEGTGVGVRQEAGLLEDEGCHGGEVVDGGGVPVPLQPLAGDGVAVLRCLTEGEEGLVAAVVGAVPGDLEHLLWSEEWGLEACGRLGEGAVAAPVPTESGEGDEDLGAVGDAVAMGPVPHVCGCRQEFLEGEVQEFGRRRRPGDHRVVPSSRVVRPGPGRLRMCREATGSLQEGQRTRCSIGVSQASWTRSVGGPSTAHQRSPQAMSATRAGERSRPRSVRWYSWRSGRSW